MSTHIITEIDELKIIYKEIIDGCTPHENGEFFVKHLNEIENADLIKERQRLFLDFIKSGLPTEEERVKFLLENDLWSADKEDELQSCVLQITDNEKNLPKVIVAQQPMIRGIIDNLKKRLKELRNEKYSLLGATADEYAEKHSLQYFLYLTMYKDTRFSNRVFSTPSDLQDLEENELLLYTDALDRTLKRLSEDKIKRIAVLSFFLNPFSYCKESVYHFLGKPICYATNAQILLFSLGGRNLNILSESDGDPPELIGETKLNDIVDWYDKNYSVLLGKRKSNK